MSERREPLVMVGVDGSQNSKDALRWAVAHAAAVSGRVHAVMCWEWSRNPFNMGTTGTASGMVTPEELAREKLDEILRETLGDTPPVRVNARVEQGAPAHVLVELSDDAETVVVGTRGYGGFKNALLGSVSTQVVQYARCTVVVVRAEGDTA
ncbi:universal stress protein [Streptomyces sp. NPDC001941]|uniref:universal stress protein n=1 Tax=Streptomyces sp. NPDC001941 TaxID=3154659 RepID=UPI003319A5A3